nr:Crp/Fnr family transcriptional regulator [Oscillospiraceae bacterium]
MEVYRFLSQTFLFSNLEESAIVKLLEKRAPKIIEYKRGDEVYSSSNKEKLIGFIFIGRCEVRRNKCDGARVVLNELKEKDSFGVLSIYSEDEFPTQIFASLNSSVLFFTAEDIRYFVNNCSQISNNLIVFLADRISFLNKKITTFSGTRVEDRLAAFLLCERSVYGSDFFPFNIQKTASEINAGRASVYRALDALSEAHLISITDKKIYILDREGLERNLK